MVKRFLYFCTFFKKKAIHSRSVNDIFHALNIYLCFIEENGFSVWIIWGLKIYYAELFSFESFCEMRNLMEKPETW
jgi:hypothetical protein